MTAAQTLQHPWVQAMTAACSQGALTDITQESDATTAAAQSGTEQQQRPEAAGDDESERPATANSSHVADTDTAEEQTQVKPDSSRSAERPVQSPGPVQEDRAPETVSVRTTSQDETKADSLAHTPSRTSLADQQQTQQASSTDQEEATQGPEATTTPTTTSAGPVSPTASPNQQNRLDDDDDDAPVQPQPADTDLPAQEDGPQEESQPGSPTPPQDKSDLHISDPPIDAS